MSTSSAPLLRLPPSRAVWVVAWPVVLLGWLRTLYLAADAWWVGRLGAAELTALSAISFAWWIVLQVGELAATGVHAKVAQAEGAGRRDEGLRQAGQGLLLAGGVGLVVGVGTPLWSGAYLDALALRDPAVREGAAALLGVIGPTAGLYAVQAVVGAVFRGVGHTRAALGIAGLGLCLNVVLDPLFIWGLGPVPALGLAGAAWASALATALDAAVGLVVLHRLGLAPTLGWPVVAALRRLVAIGAPVALRGVGFSLVYVLLGPMITAHGDLQLAALGVGHRLEGFTYLAAVGYGVGAATLVGQHLGAGDVAGARGAARAAALACSGWMLAGALLALVGAPALYGVFTDDPALVAAGAVYLRSQALVWLFMGVESVYEGAFAGAGHTTPPLVIGASLTVARLPLAWLLDSVLGWGVLGIWAAIALSTLAKGVCLALWFEREGWAVKQGILSES